MLTCSTHHLNDFSEVLVQVGDSEWVLVGLWRVLDFRRADLQVEEWKNWISNVWVTSDWLFRWTSDLTRELTHSMGLISLEERRRLRFQGQSSFNYFLIAKHVNYREKYLAQSSSSWVSCVFSYLSSAWLWLGTTQYCQIVGKSKAKVLVAWCHKAIVSATATDSNSRRGKKKLTLRWKATYGIRD